MGCSISATHFAEAAGPVCHCHSSAIPLFNTHKAFRFLNSLCGGGRMTCLPLPFACNSIIDTHEALRFCNSLCGAGRVTCPPLPFTCNSVINTLKALTCPPLPFACNSVINTHKAFHFLNSLCGGGRVTCLPLPFACNSVINTHKAFRFCNSLSWTSPSPPALAAWPILFSVAIAPPDTHQFQHLLCFHYYK